MRPIYYNFDNNKKRGYAYNTMHLIVYVVFMYVVVLQVVGVEAKVLELRWSARVPRTRHVR